MPSYVTQTSIANRALQLVGYEPIGSLNDANRGARAINRAYLPVRDSELRKNFWNFSIKRAILAASTVTPLFGKSFYYPLPVDFLDLCAPDQINTYNWGPVPSLPGQALQQDDFSIENMGDNTNAIASNMDSPIYIRYVSNSISESVFDAAFCEAFSAALGLMVCEELTQSGGKMKTLEDIYEEAIDMARKRNAFEMKPITPPVDRYITVRM